MIIKDSGRRLFTAGQATVSAVIPASIQTLVLGCR